MRSKQGPFVEVSADGCVQVLAKTLDSTQLTTDKLEVSTITRDESHGGRVSPFLSAKATRCSVILASLFYSRGMRW